jgi:3-deoxy-D-manno-octulosonic acid (KDO) 8-phosphate synthase
MKDISFLLYYSVLADVQLPQSAHGQAGGAELQRSDIAQAAAAARQDRMN